MNLDCLLDNINVKVLEGGNDIMVVAEKWPCSQETQIKEFTDEVA